MALSSEWLLCASPEKAAEQLPSYSIFCSTSLSRKKWKATKDKRTAGINKANQPLPLQSVFKELGRRVRHTPRQRQKEPYYQIKPNPISRSEGTQRHLHRMFPTHQTFLRNEKQFKFYSSFNLFVKAKEYKVTIKFCYASLYIKTAHYQLLPPASFHQNNFYNPA